MAFVTREYTSKILDLIEEGVLDNKALAEQLLMWLSERDVERFWRANDYQAYFGEEEEEDDSPMNDFNYVGSPDHY